MFSKITQSPTLVRVLPFAVFLALTFFQDRCGDAARYWIYLGKTIAGGAMLVAVYRHIPELEWRFTWEALAIGVGVFAFWVGLDGHYPSVDAINSQYICPFLQKLGLAQSCAASEQRAPWNPNLTFGGESPLTLFFIVARIVGSTLVVPALEETFYRSFVYRFLASKDFLALPLGKFLAVPFFVTSILFGLGHREWLAGILCGFAYQGLVIWKNRLGDAVTAHAITNFLLGLWIVWKGAWHFW
jgi:membrane protease YdiL (CAAX protease family)